MRRLICILSRGCKWQRDGSLTRAVRNGGALLFSRRYECERCGRERVELTED